MNTVLATIVTIVLFVPVAIYFFSVVGRDRERPEPEPQETPQVEEDGTAVIVTVNRPESNQTTNVALTWIKQVITGGRDKPAIEPPAPKPAPQNDGPEWTPPTDLDDLPDLSDFDVQVQVNRPALDATSPPENPPAAEAVAIERGLLDRVRDWLGGGGTSTPPPLGPAPGTVQPPALGQADPDWLDTIPDPRQFPEPQHQPLPDLDLPALDVIDNSGGFDVHVEHIPAQPAEPPPEATASTAAVEVIEPVEVIAPIELQGVDMELVPVGRRTMARVPTVTGLVNALRTGGYRILHTWLASFRKADLHDLGNAQRIHRMALMQAQRSRVKLAIAINQLQAVQSDRLGPNVIRACTNTVLHCHREATAAFQVVTHTEALVRASGGVPVSLRDAIRALEHDHGDMARARRRMTVEPADMTFYEH
ncbi:hypothetical protein [Nonomuraea sp. NPDC050202]|uniref:hypothetical protein n=1 Tax=Nonomuraea sp. NPDC050202 TaxID=3155035 RepID=UPI0033E340C3